MGCSGCLEPGARLGGGEGVRGPPLSPGPGGRVPRHYLEVGVPWPSCSRELVA